MSGFLESLKLQYAHDAIVLAGIENGSVRGIPLTRGMIAVVDLSDYEMLAKHKWYAHKKKTDHTCYARRRGKLDGGKVTIFMHRELLNLTHQDGIIPDHKNHNGLDNRRENLRIASPSLNRHNSKLLRTNTSGFRGVDQVTYIKKNGERSWRVRISFEGQRIIGKSYCSIIDAAIAYDLMAIKLWGTEIPLNFPERRHEYVLGHLQW